MKNSSSKELHDPDELNRFLEMYKLQKLTQEAIENLIDL